MTTPNGRFKTDTRLCLSISDYHPDTWNPAWSVATILTGLLSFMLERSPTLGSIESTEADKKRLAARSHEFNLKNRVFCELFPDVAAASKDVVEKRKKKALQKQVRNRFRVARIKNSYYYSMLCTPFQAANGDSCPNQNRLESNEMAAAGGGALQSTLANFLVIGGFAAFAFVVQYVLQTIAATND